MRREYKKWFSPSLGRDMELLVFGHAGPRALVFPTREGRFFDYENWHLVNAASPPILSGQLQLFCLDSVDSESFYNQTIPPAARIARHILFEKYILEEVLPFTTSLNPHPSLIAHGCSLGAYHAVNLAFRHPDLFSRVLALSGRYDLTKPTGPFRGLFDGFYNEDIYFHSPPHFLAKLADPAILAALRRLDITLAVGHDDAFAPSTRELSLLLNAQSIPHRLDIWPGEAHRSYHWRQMIRHYFPA